MRSSVLLLLLGLLVPLSVPGHSPPAAVHDNAVYYEEQGMQPTAGEVVLLQKAVGSLRDIPPGGVLLMPHSGTKSVMSFDPHTGELLDSYFFAADEENLGTPIKLIWNFTGTSMFISDQVKKLVQEYSPTGEFLGTFAPQGGVNDDIMNNVRGTLLRPNGHLLVSVSGGANMHSVIEFDLNGEYLGQFISAGAGGLDNPWDIVFRDDHNDYLVSASGSNGILRYDINGEFIEMFATGLNFPQQMQLLANGNVLVTNFSSPAGLYEFSPTGEQLNYWNVVGSLRGVHELGNGNILVTNSAGVHEINRQNQVVSVKVTGQSRWITHIKPLDIGELYNLQLQVNPQGAGTVNGGGNYPEDYMVNITATPGFFYDFVNWTIDGSQVSDQASFQYQMPANDVVLTANFEPKVLKTVTFHVMEDSDDQNNIEGALVTVDGFDPVMTNESGFAVLQLPSGNYSATVTAQGYSPESLDFSIGDVNLNLPVMMSDIIVPPASLAVDVDQQVPGSALLTWETFVEREFRWDDGTVIGQLGSTSGTLNTVLGSVHRNSAVLQSMSWYLTDNGGPHNTVKVWVFGLDAGGHPNPGDVLFSQEGVANTDQQWNTFEFPTPVEAPEGFLIGVSYQGFLGIGRDSGVNPDWPFQTLTHYFCGNVTTGDFAAVETLGDFENNFLIRAFGVDNGELPLKQSAATGSDSDKAFTGFNVYLNDMDTPVAEQLTGLEYLFTDLPGGDYIAGVQSVYTTGVSDIVTIGFLIDITYSVTFEIEDQQGTPITDAIITLGDTEYDPGEYIFTELMPGTYQYAVNREGYIEATGEVVITGSDVTVQVVLAEEQYFDVTFRVHMHYFSGFDPANDEIFITGCYCEWAPPGSLPPEQSMAVSDDDPMVYQITLSLAGGSNKYKYYINEGWEGGEWNGGSDREIMVIDHMTVNNVFGDPTDETLGIVIPDLKGFILYPNPSSGTLNILSDYLIYEADVIDLTGQVVYTQVMNGKRAQVDVSWMPQGIYLVRMRTAKGYITGRVRIMR